MPEKDSSINNKINELSEALIDNVNQDKAKELSMKIKDDMESADGIPDICGAISIIIAAYAVANNLDKWQIKILYIAMDRMTSRVIDNCLDGFNETKH